MSLGAQLEATADLPVHLPWNGRCEIGWGPCWDEALHRAALTGRWPSVEFQEIVLSPDAPCQVTP